MIKKFIALFVILFSLRCDVLIANSSELLKCTDLSPQLVTAVNTRLNQLFKISFGIEFDVEKQLCCFIDQINGNDVGTKLLQRLVFLIRSLQEFHVGNYDGIIHITFNEGTGTSFIGRGYKASRTSRFGSTPEQPMRVYLNIDFNNKNIIFNPKCGLGTLIPAIKLRAGHSEFCEIGHCFDPFWITIAHELIHMEHFLTEELNKFVMEHIYISKKLLTKEQITEYFKNKSSLDQAIQKIKNLNKFKGFGIDIFENLPIPEETSIETLQEYYKFLNNPFRFHARYSDNLSKQGWEGLSQVIPYFPELNARKTGRKSLSFFANLEERETVIGARCSELMIRIAEENRGNILPIRYLYQDMDTFFLEKISVILEIINRARINLGMPELTQENLIDKLSHKNLLSFFNFGIFSHIITEELMPD